VVPSGTTGIRYPTGRLRARLRGTRPSTDPLQHRPTHVALCLSSLYPIPVYCEGTLQPLQQLPCQKAPFYTIFRRNLSTTGGDENRPPPVLAVKTRNRAPPECLPLSGCHARDPFTPASHPQVLDETIAVPKSLSSTQSALIHLYFAFGPRFASALFPSIC